MAVCCGKLHTITLSNDGTLHSFGNNSLGQLGLGLDHNIHSTLPTPIPNLPKIKMISCGSSFTMCVDYEGFIWSFGENDSGQLGIGNHTNQYFNVPQKLCDIPPGLSVSCGGFHTLIITTDSNLWSCGNNKFGQLCLGNQENQFKPQKTAFSDISKISAGCDHSLFQNNEGEIFACGYNEDGACGLGHFNHYQITPSIIPNMPPNIVHFVCGYHQNLFLDSKGKVFAVGSNVYGHYFRRFCLGHNTNLNVLKKIRNIPSIQTISCVGENSYLIDFEGNLWTFGKNVAGQLGHGDYKNKNTPKVIKTLKDIQQISYGSCGYHFFAKNSQNQIFATGFNNYGQLGIGTRDTQTGSIPKEIDSQYSTIWRDEHFRRAKSARK